MATLTAGSLYLEVRAAVGPLFESAPENALDQFGLQDLLDSSDIIERNAAYALAEAQGRAGATSNVISRIALAGVQLPSSTAYAMSLDVRPALPDGPRAILGSNGVERVAMTDGNGRLHCVEPGSFEIVASPLDPDYLNIITHLGSAFGAPELPGAESALARARIACAAESLGVCEAMLADAVQYAGVRLQFGKPLSAFQAVAHSLAWAATEIHQLRALIQACLHSDAIGAPDPTLAAVTKSMAGTVGRRVAQTTLQVTGGMGFTWEYPHNAQHRRALALDSVAGSADALNFELGGRLRARDVGELISLSALSGQG